MRGWLRRWRWRLARRRRVVRVAIAAAIAAAAFAVGSQSRGASLERGGDTQNLLDIYFNSSSLSSACLDFAVEGVCVRYRPVSCVQFGANFGFSEPVAFIETGAEEDFESFLPIVQDLVELVNGLGLDEEVQELILEEVLPGFTVPDLPELDPTVGSGGAESGNETQFTEARAVGIPYVYTYVLETVLDDEDLVCDDTADLCSFSLAYDSSIDFCWHTGVCDLFDTLYSSVTELGSGDFSDAGSEFLGIFSGVPGFCLLDVIDRGLEDLDTDSELLEGDLGEEFGNLFDETGGFGLGAEGLGQSVGSCSDCGAGFSFGALENQFTDLSAGLGDLTSDMGPALNDFTGSNRSDIENLCLGSWGPLRMREGHQVHTSDLTAQAKAGYTAAHLGFEPGILNVNSLWADDVQGQGTDVHDEQYAEFTESLSEIGIEIDDPAGGGGEGGGGSCDVSVSSVLRFDEQTEIHNRMQFQELFPKVDTCNQIGDIPVGWQATDKLEPWGDLLSGITDAEGAEDLSVLQGQFGASLWNRQSCCLYLVTVCLFAY